MATPPTLISYTETVWNTGANPNNKTSASISWQTGDVVAIMLAAEGAGTLSVTNPAGLTFVQQVINTAASTCATLIKACIAPGTSSATITANLSTLTIVWGFAVWVYRGSDGIGASVEGHTTAKTVNLTSQQANSAIVYGGFDFGANAVTNNNILPVPTNSRQRAVQAGNYTTYVADLADQPSTSAVAYGVNGAGTIGAFSKVVLEVKGAAGGGGGGGKPWHYYQQMRQFRQEQQHRERLIERAYRETILRKAA